jgi:hypothetical protein
MTGEEDPKKPNADTLALALFPVYNIPVAQHDLDLSIFLRTKELLV